MSGGDNIVLSMLKLEKSESELPGGAASDHSAIVVDVRVVTTGTGIAWSS